MNGIVPLRDELPKIKVQKEVKVMAVAKKIKTSPLGESAIEFLNKRGISEDTAKKAKLRFAKSWIPSEQAEVDCIFFPYTTRVRNTLRRLERLKAKGLLCNGAPQTF